MKKITIGILAHVDAGKTTLSEALLYQSGTIRSLGRVDHKDAFLDTDDMERERGITIFSKMARFTYECREQGQEDTPEFILLDTPGHADFTAEMERTLAVLDYAVLVISGTDGIQGHTKTLWRLLESYDLPCFLFVNKMDISHDSPKELERSLQKELSDACVSFMSFYDREHFSCEEEQEAIAMCREDLMEHFLETGALDRQRIREGIGKRDIFPVIFGSALKVEGIATLLEAFGEWMRPSPMRPEMGARCYKIGRDRQGNRLTYLKITGGSLHVRDSITYRSDTCEFTEKISQIRLYHGEKYETVEEVEAGEICAVLGLSASRAGMTLGACSPVEIGLIEPVLSYQVIPPQGVSTHTVLDCMRRMEEEDPALHVLWQEGLDEIHVHLMGPVQTEFLQRRIKEQYGILVTFGPGAVRYKETIRGSVEGVGHFEPLRHYAEVHLLLEELPQGSGMEAALDCSTDLLDAHWQRLIYDSLKETIHPGVLTGAPLTDMRITLLSGKAHLKHTDGGDFRQATFRALRQGLRKADNVLLEPYYQVCLEVPAEQIGRAMTDMERMHGRFEGPFPDGEMALLNGQAPVAMLRNYGVELASYTAGRGRMHVSLAGYFPCQEQETVVEQSEYDPDRDVEHPCDSVFCARGAGYIVPWYEVEEHMHLPTAVPEEKAVEAEGEETMIVRAKREAEARRRAAEFQGTRSSGVGGMEAELEEIFRREFGEEKRRLPSQEKRIRDYDRQETIRSAREDYESTHKKTKIGQGEKAKHYLLVDGYNIIHAWPSLREIAAENLDGARGRLMDILTNYCGHTGVELILVFDAYRIRGHQEEVVEYQNIHVVYTKEAETADAFIERTTHEIVGRNRVTVATSDRLEQMIVLGHGAYRMSAKELEREVERINEMAMEQYQNREKGEKG